MHKKILVVNLTLAVSLELFLSFGLAAEKARWGVHFRDAPYYGLPAWAAFEKGFWRDQGLEVEIAEFASGTVLVSALAASAVDVGTLGIESVPIAISRGVPMVMVADPKMKVEFLLLVLANSPMKKFEELKGGAIGITRLGSTPHRLAATALERAGLKGQVKFVATGREAAGIAVLKTGMIQAYSSSSVTMPNLLAAGEVRVLVSLNELVPEATTGQVIFAHTEFLRANPEAVRKAARGFILGATFILKNQDWAMERIVNKYKFSRQGAKLAFENFRYGSDGKLDLEKIKIALAYVVATGQLAKDKAPLLEKVYVKGYDD